MTKKTDTGLFSDLGIDFGLLSILTKKKFLVPTPIQHQVIEAGIQGKDIIGIAQTGTGKTLAFGIPMIEKILKTRKQGLVIVPTRELALQVEKALKDISSSLGFKFATLIGGTSKGLQVRQLRQNPQIIVATPGRLADLMNSGDCNLDKIDIIALDEADRMLDVGFLPEIKRILKQAPKERQTLLFSATMPNAISSLASEFMKLPLRVEVAPQGTSAKNVEQELFVIPKNDKIRLLDSILDEYKEDTIIIFSRTKHGAKRIARDIRNMGHTATEIHSNRSQAQRKVALDGFSSGRFRIMVATDIAARGIDIKHLSLVINYDLPDCTEDYVHRIGRTGRAGNTGKAISFVCPEQRSDVKKIERLIRKSLPILALPELPANRQKSDNFQDRNEEGNRGVRGRNGNDRGESRDRARGRNRNDRGERRDRARGRNGDDRRENRNGRDRNSTESKSRKWSNKRERQEKTVSKSDESSFVGRRRGNGNFGNRKNRKPTSNGRGYSHSSRNKKREKVAN